MIVFGMRKSPQWRRLRRQAEVLGMAGDIVVRRFEIPAGTAELSGRRLVFFSDLHWDRRDMGGSEALVQAVNALEADWLACGGDIIQHLEHLGPALDILGQLRARQKKLAVLGNWERMHQWRSTERWRRDFAAGGFELLVNEVWQEEHSPVFVGLDDYRWQTPKPELADSYRNGQRPVVCLTHSPDSVAEPPPGFVGNLALAGHTHGGQLCLPVLGPVYTSSHYWRKFAHGWFRRLGPFPAELYVSSGIGCNGNSIFRRRLFCPPEIVVIDWA